LVWPADLLERTGRDPVAGQLLYELVDQAGFAQTRLAADQDQDQDQATISSAGGLGEFVQQLEEVSAFQQSHRISLACRSGGTQ
jgi:hypothetical protein